MQRDGGRKKSDKIISCKGTERKGLWKGGRERVRLYQFVE